MANQSLIRQEDLAEWLGYDQKAAIEKWLSERGVPFEICRGKIVTTLNAINAGLIGAEQKDAGFEFK